MPGRKPHKSKSAGVSLRWRTLRPAIGALLTIAVVVAVIAAINWLGGEALRGVGSRERYQAAFAEIQCDTPAGMDRARFLAEVRYVSQFAETFQYLEEAEQKRLAEAFLLHPWVKSVEGISVEPGNVVRVALKFRVPIVAVRDEAGTVRLVDDSGILLPESEPPPGVAWLDNVVAVPAVSPGQVWTNAIVKKAAELAKAYSPARLDRRWTGWRLEKRDGTILYVVPGSEGRVTNR
jgi:hypothetical protein